MYTGTKFGHQYIHVGESNPLHSASEFLKFYIVLKG